jgi:lipopolysaccharide export system protein LptA
MNSKYNLILYIIILLSFSEANARQLNQIEISAELLEIDHNKNTAFFTGQVVVKNKDTKIFADKLVVYYNETTTTPNSKEQIQKVIANGNLKIINADQLITGNTAVYNPSSKTIEIIGNVVIIRDNNKLTGEKATYNMNTGISMILGDNNTKSGRAKATILDGKE